MVVPHPLPPVQVVHVHNAGVVRRGGHVDDPGAAALSSRTLQVVQQQVRQQEVAEVVEGKVELKAVLRLLLGDQHGSSYRRHNADTESPPWVLQIKT